MPNHSPHILLREEEVEFIAIRAQGAGGQNVNKVSNAIHLRFNVGASSLPEEIKERLLQLRDQRVSSDGVVVIKAQQHRSLERNRIDASCGAGDPARDPAEPKCAARTRRQQGQARAGEGFARTHQ